MVILALSFSDLFSPLASLAQYVLEGLVNFLAYAKCLILGSFYDLVISLLDAFPTDWKSSIDEGLSGFGTVFKSADIFLPMSFIFGLLGFLFWFSISFWSIRFVTRISFLGFKVGG